MTYLVGDKSVRSHSGRGERGQSGAPTSKVIQRPVHEVTETSAFEVIR